MSTTLPLQTAILKELPTSLQLLQTLKNVQKLSPLNLASPTFKSTLLSYSESNLILYKQKTTQQSPTYNCYLKEQRLQNNIYINQLTKQLIKVQPLDGAIIQKKPLQNSENTKQILSQHNYTLIKSLHSKLSTYTDMHYSQHPSAITCTYLSQQSIGHFTINTQEQKIQQITIGITNKLNNRDNFYTGETLSYWTFQPKQYTVFIKASNHFYQNGNIIFNRQKPIQKQQYQQNHNIDLDNFNQKQIDNIINLIKKQQQTFKKQLESLFTKKCSQALKKIRRVTPLTQNKMIWNINAVRMNQEINVQLPKLAL